jgi:hypothetical protein
MAQRFYQKASVQVAMVSGIVLLLATCITICHQRSELREQNAVLSALTQKQTAEIQRLETILTPFRTIALEKYAGPEGEALRQLGENISAIDASLANAREELASTKRELLQRTSDRSLTEEQKRSLKSSLSAVSGKVLVKADFADSEAQMFANQIEACLRTTDLEIVQQGFTGITAIHAKGVRILVKDVHNQPPHTSAVQKALQSAGIEALTGVAESAQFPDDALIIWVCHR